MKIEIGKYLLRSDSDNIILTKIKGKKIDKKTGEPYYTTVGYYSTVTQAVQAIENDHLKDSDATTLKELLEEAREMRKTIALMLEGI